MQKAFNKTLKETNSLDSDPHVLINQLKMSLTDILVHRLASVGQIKIKESLEKDPVQFWEEVGRPFFAGTPYLYHYHLCKLFEVLLIHHRTERTRNRLHCHINTLCISSKQYTLKEFAYLGNGFPQFITANRTQQRHVRIGKKACKFCLLVKSTPSFTVIN